MTAIIKVWNAMKSLADNLSALSATVAEVNDGLRQKVGLRKIVPAIEAKGSKAKAAE